MSELSIERPPIQVFLSYTRQDDEVFGFAEPLKQSLETILKVMSGRPAEVFFDRQSINLGDNWHEKITQGAKSSLIFLAMYSANYVESEACREEFMLFQAQSARLNVSRLLIPVVLLGYESLAAEHQDEISDYVRAHQFVDYEQAWIQGSDSSAFRQVVSDIAKRVVQALDSVEDTLAAAEVHLAEIAEDRSGNQSDPTSTIREANDYSDNGNDGSSIHDLGLFDLSADLESKLNKITDETQVLGSSLSEFNDIPPRPHNIDSPRVASKYMIQVAETLKNPSERVGQHGKNLLDTVRDSDDIIARIVSLLLEGATENQIEEIHTELARNMNTLGTLDEIVVQMQNLLDSMKSVEMLSASVRKAVRPARAGITAVQDSVRIITRWPDMIDTLIRT